MNVIMCLVTGMIELVPSWIRILADGNTEEEVLRCSDFIVRIIRDRREVWIQQEDTVVILHGYLLRVTAESFLRASCSLRVPASRR